MCGGERPHEKRKFERREDCGFIPRYSSVKTTAQTLETRMYESLQYAVHVLKTFHIRSGRFAEPSKRHFDSIFNPLPTW